MLFKKPIITGKVSILIPVRGDSRYTLELCYKSIKKNTDYSDYRFILCDDGVDADTANYLADLEKWGDVKLIKSTNPGIPKDDLAKAVDTEYYIFMHDDIKILRKDWLTRRMALMQKDAKNAIVGSVVKNFGNEKVKRFLPLGLLVKTDISRKLNLIWGKDLEKGFDTGGLAYQQFLSQEEYRFIPYKVSRDIYHFGSMTWVKCKDKNFPHIDELLKEREEKIKLIRYWLDNNKY